MVSKNDLRVGIKFETDNTQLELSRQKLTELTKNLKEIQVNAHNMSIMGNATPEIQKAAEEAKKLEQILNQSWNSKLGQLDLNKFNSSLKVSKIDVENMRMTLSQMGPIGVQTFNNIASSVLNTNIQLKQSSVLLNKMALTMANTIRFGISSSIFNNLTGSISKAYDYVKKLDKSLNDIRIVSNASAGDMERFAKYANTAAKSLGSSTLDYTQGALIYYQQGLEEQQVKERTDITLKMSNVLGTSAQEVSDYMTAIWNNFDNGSKSLEYYADVLTKLGAETASSAEEISQGLEKFAAISNTVGLSYEYAAAALTTVTDKTRQSADVVGTAFKTLFARIQDLELGKTLDDGTTLGKYSEALAAVGVNIKDQNGQLKSMDAILDEMGSKWGSLADDQKVALAQNVAGVRQYTQLMSLMENWGSFQKNVESARNASGALQHQQDIYLESTEAHLQKLSTEAQKTYDIVFDTDTINDFSDALTGVLSVFNTFLGSFGSGTNVLTFFAGTLTSLFSKQIGGAIEKQIENVQILKANMNADELKQQFAENIVKQHTLEGESVDVNSTQVQTEAEVAMKVAKFKEQISQEDYNQLMLLQKQMGEDAQLLKNAENYERHLTNEEKARYETLAQMKAALKNSQEEVKTLQKKQQIVVKIKADLEKMNDMSPEERSELMMEDKTSLTENNFKDLGLSEDQLSRVNEILLNSKDISEATDIINGKINDINGSLKTQEETEERLSQAVEERSFYESENYKNLTKEQQERMNLLNQMEQQAARQKAISEGVREIGSAVAIFSSLKGMWTTLNDESLSSVEILGKLAGSLVALVPSLIGFITHLGTLKASLFALIPAETAAGMTGAQMWLAILGPIALVIAGVALVGAAIYSLVKNLNADAEAAQRASKEAEALTQNYEKLQSAADELKKTISDYDAGCKALEELNEGTEEYGKTLDEVNEKAKTLIETYGLYDKYHTGTHGEIVFDDGVLDEIQGEADEQANAAKQEMYAAKMNANVMQMQSKATDVSRGTGVNWKAVIKDAVIGSVGSYFGGGLVGGAMIGSFVNNPDKYNKYSKDQMLEVAEGLNELRNSLSEGEFDALMKKNTDDLRKELLTREGVPQVIKDNIDAYLENKEALDSFAKSLNDATKQNEYYTKQILESMVSEQYGSKIKELAGDNEGRASLITSIIAGNKKEIQEEMTKDFNANSLEAKNVSSNKDLNKYRGEGAKTFNDEELAREYARLILKRKDADDLIYTSGNDKGGLKTSSGEVILDEDHTDDAKRQALAKYYLDQETKEEYASKINGENSLKTIESIMGKASEAGQKYGTDFTDALLSAATSEDHKINLSDTFARIDPNEYKELTEMSDEDLLNAFNLSPEELKELGYDSSQDFADAFQEGLKSYEWDADKAIAASLNESTDDWEGMGLDTKEVSDYAKHLMEVSDKADELADSLKYDSDSALVVARSVMRMNKGIENLSDNYDEWSDVLKKSQKSSQEYSDALNGMQSSLADILDTEEDLISDDFVQKHLDEIGKAAKGDEKAIENLHKELAKQLIIDSATDLGLASDEIDNLIDKFNKLDIPKLDVGEKISFSTDNLDKGYQDFLETMGDIIGEAGMTADEANALFSQMGFQANFATTEEDVPQEVPEYVTEEIPENGVDLTYTDSNGQQQTRKGLRTRTRTYQDGVFKATGKMSVVAMETSKDGKKIPKINSIVKKATGSFNNNSSKNKGGGSKKSGGGKSKKAEEQKIDFTPDRYHAVNTQISKTDNLLKQLQVSESHALGPELLDNYAKQWEELNNQVANYNDKLNIATDEYNELYDTLIKDGVKFNEDGTVANYMDILIQKRDEYNKLVTQYNKMAEKDQENFKKKVLDPAKEAFDQFKENLDRIDELISSTMKEIESNIRDTVDQKIELAVKEFDVKIKYSADIKDLTITVNDFIEKTVKGLKDDDIFGNFLLNQKNLGALLSSDGQSGYLVDLADQLKNTGMQFEKMANEATIFGDNVEKGLDYYGEKLDDFIQGYTDLIERQKAIKQAFTDLYDSVNEKVQTQIEYYDKVSSILDHHKKVIELIYGEKAYGKLKKLSDLQIQNGKKELLTLQQARDVNQGLIESKNTQIIAAKENLETIKTQYGVESEIYKQKIKELQDLEEERKKLIVQDIEYANQIEDKFDEVADAINNSLTEAIGDIINQLNNALSPNGLDYAQEQWELITRDAEIYLDTINRLQGENSLESKYLDSINKATDPSVQKKLKAAMDAELKALREKDNLTQYDLDRAEKKYQITLAQIALEEAQQNKSEMRLRRDSQGNYRYQYVADESAVNKAKQDLNNAYVDLYNFDKERYLEVNNTILDLTKETQDKIKEIWADTSKSYEEREAEAALWTEKLNSQIAKYQTERIATEANLNESAFDNLKVLYENDEQAFEEAVSDKDKTLKQLIPQLASEGAEIAKNTNLVELNEEAAKAAQAAALEATGLIKENLQDIKEDLQDIEEGANAAIDSLESLVKDNEDSIAEDLANLKIIDATIAQNQEIIDSFTNEKNIIDLVEKSYRNLIEAKKDLIENYDEKNEGGQNPTHVVDPTEYQKLVDNAKQKIIDNMNKGSGEGSGEEPKVETENYPYGKASETSGTIKSGSKGNAVKAIQYALNKLGYGNSGTQSVDGDFGPGTKSAVIKFQKAMGLTADGQVGKNTRKKFKAQGFASGGYTGTWGNGARLAFLHQKELVLNAQDTENILNTVAIMRNLMTSLNDNILSRLANVSAGTVRGLDSGNNELEQNVHIEANFPSVTSANEIEAAIKNLVNVASQRIHE